MRVGMTKAALYYHFPSKEEVLQALLAPFLDDVDRIIAATAAGQWSKSELVKRLIAQMNDRGEFLYAVMSDPSVKHAMFERLGMANRTATLLRVLAGSDEPTAMLRGRCAMGALMSGLLGHGPHGPAVPPRRTMLSPDEQRVVCAAVLAVLGSSDEQLAQDGAGSRVDGGSRVEGDSRVDGDSRECGRRAAVRADAGAALDGFRISTKLG
jgi:AcrR family transcriptional regulator